MAVYSFSYVSSLIASRGLPKCKNAARKGSWPPPSKTACSNRYWGWNIPIMVYYRDTSLMESVPLLWHHPPVLNKSGAAFSFPTTLPFVRLCLLSSLKRRSAHHGQSWHIGKPWNMTFTGNQPKGMSFPRTVKRGWNQVWSWWIWHQVSQQIIVLVALRSRPCFSLKTLSHSYILDYLGFQSDSICFYLVEKIVGVRGQTLGQPEAPELTHFGARHSPRFGPYGLPRQDCS